MAYLKFNEVKTLTVELAEVETSVIRLAEAIQRPRSAPTPWATCRSPDAKTIKSIDEVLSEREREEFSRLKVIKAQKERRSVTLAAALRASIARPQELGNSHYV